MSTPEVLFVCVHNAGRSQMAAALLEHHGAGRVVVRSAGSAPADTVNPAVVEVMAELGLRADPVSTQIVQRDRHAALVTAIAILGGSLERFATEIRNLQHTEIGEVMEPFKQGQKGSSAMPHKRNPILSERIAGYAPGDLNRVFFTTGGGEAVESAWKLAKQFFKLTGKPGKHKVVSRSIAYHGTPQGALSITGIPAFKAPFEPLVPAGLSEMRSLNFVSFASRSMSGSAKMPTMLMNCW